MDIPQTLDVPQTYKKFEWGCDLWERSQLRSYL